MLLASPRKVKIYGLPRSGTNFAEFMVCHNLGFEIALFDYGWKHDFPAKDLPIPSLFVTKNIYSWLWSIYNFAKDRISIFHLRDDISFGDFVTGHYIWDSDIAGKGSPMVYHQASTPVDHWVTMNKSWFSSSYFIKYEDLLLDTEKVLDGLSSHLRVSRRDLVFPNKRIRPAGAMKAGKSTSNVFDLSFTRNREYMAHFSDELHGFVDSRLDHAFANSLGYSRL